jgi:hypothetical protein
VLALVLLLSSALLLFVIINSPFIFCVVGKALTTLGDVNEPCFSVNSFLDLMRLRDICSSNVRSDDVLTLSFFTYCGNINFLKDSEAAIVCLTVSGRWIDEVVFRVKDIIS